MEFEYRPTALSTSFVRTGIQTTNFLFDICNFLNGFSKI